MNDDLFLGKDFDSESTAPINFLESRIHDLSPFSALQVVLDGVVYKTAEHAYQALRVKESYRSLILKAKSPQAAWRIGQSCKKDGALIPGIDKDALMERIFRAKLSQHEDVKHILLATGDRELQKVFDNDYYWSTGADGSGENRMGKLWMKLRAGLKK